MATITQKEWKRYISRLRQINDRAAEEFRQTIIDKGGYGNIERQKLIDYAYGVSTKYGEASAALSAEMYDAVAELSGAGVPAAVPAEIKYQDVAKTVNGIIKNTGSDEILTQGIGRLVKRAGTDTILSNAYRDRGKGSKRKHSGAQVAWVPVGDTCPFCLMLASKGWVSQTEWGANNHSEHIHANCDCTYAVRFNSNLTVEGYDPDKLREDYLSAGDNQKDRLNAMRREQYAEDPEKYREQKRENYADKKLELAHNKTGQMSSEEYARASELWSSVKEIKIPNREKIVEEFDNWLTPEEKSQAIVRHAVDNYWYTAVNKGHNQYKFYQMVPVEPSWMDEIMTEVIGPDWRRYE